MRTLRVAKHWEVVIGTHTFSAISLPQGTVLYSWVVKAEGIDLGPTTKHI